MLLTCGCCPPSLYSINGLYYNSVLYCDNYFVEFNQALCCHSLIYTLVTTQYFVLCLFVYIYIHMPSCFCVHIKKSTHAQLQVTTITRHCCRNLTSTSKMSIPMCKVFFQQNVIPALCSMLLPSY